MLSIMNTSDNFDSFIYCAATVALAASIVLPILQLDLVAKAILSPDRLRVRRRSEALHYLEKSVSIAFKNHRERICRNVDENYTVEYAKKRTEYIFSEEDMKKLAQDLLAQEEYAEIFAIEGDKEEEQSFARSIKEIYLYLSLEGGERWVQVPLTSFCIVLAEELETHMTNTTLCFVADSSGGLGPRVLGELLRQPEVGVAIVTEPTWMTALAFIIRKKLISEESMLQKILFSLCRLEAWRVRDNVGSHQTVVFFLPAFATTSTLLNLVHSTFPLERHVFGYDGCVSSVKRATSKITQLNTSITITPLQIPQSDLPYEKFAKLSPKQANAVEAWMSSVSTFLSMKDDKKHQYLPFLCRMCSIMGHTNAIGDTDLDTSKLAMINTLQYIIGSNSPLKEPLIEACFKTLVKFINLEEEIDYPLLNELELVVIEDCVSSHQGLLSNDELFDKVQPKKNWNSNVNKKTI